MRSITIRLACVLTWAASCLISDALAQVVISEIMYHPVEEPAFQANGSPVLELYEDVHEFVEIHNPGPSPLDLTGWKLSGGISFSFPSGSGIQPGEYRVIAKNPGRLAVVLAYGLEVGKILGPYTNQLSNAGESIRLQNAQGDFVDAVSYSAEFPWAISADGLGAGEDWTGINPLTYQYRGRSLERVSFSHPANDPANWLASPLPGNPSPGKPNAIARSIPKPVVISFNVRQTTDEATIIRNNQPVRIECVFSGTGIGSLSSAGVEWFIDGINVTTEPHTTTPMSIEGPPANRKFTVVLPGQLDRSIVRFRFRANRGDGDEAVSPRADDPYGWHAYFVTPVRTSNKPIYDCFISTNSLAILNNNISQSPKRVTSPDPPGTPRVSWNATQPAVMVHDGVVYDIQMRHHGSRYNRRSSRYSLKWQFPRYKKFNGMTGIFETDKGNDFIVGHNLFIEAGLPVSNVRYIDLYLNNNGVMQRLEQGEFDGDLLDAYHKTQQQLNPGMPLEPSGEIYKVVGTIDNNGEGPYGRGDGRKLAKLPRWTDLQMYDWTYALQNNGWRGSYHFKQMIDAMWAARGDTHTAPNPDIAALRTFFGNYFDIDEMLTYIAIENWCCPWDDTTQNHFLWQRRNGKWGLLPWDCDAWFGSGDNTPADSSIYIGEVGDPNNNSRGPNFFKDGFIKAFREEYKQRLYLLNNTFLHPENITAMGFGSIRSFANARFASVNEQCGLGPFQRPGKPLNASPTQNGTALPPMTLRASIYTHSASPASSHAETTWEIRAATGSYRAPIWKVTSATNLTSISIPFERLTFGETYHWRCTYFDANGHPSLASDESIFTFGPAPSQVTLLAIDGATQWKYNQTDDLTGVNWMVPNYNDSAWPSGAPLLARENCDCLPEAIRTPLTLGRTTYYFRKHFSFGGNPQGATLRLRQVIDDGCIVYLNGAEVFRSRLAGAATYDTFAGPSVSDAVAEGPFAIPSSNLRQGDNVLAVEVHQSSATSTDLTFGLALEATVPAIQGDLVLNEIAADNRGSVSNAGQAPDWIELFNNSSQTIELGGMSLSDDVLVPGKYVFPPKTLIAAQGYLTVWCDNQTNAPGLHTGFALNDKGQTVALFSGSANEPVVRDSITFGMQIGDLTIGRLANGTGEWQLTIPTPGAVNQAKGLGSAATLRLNEWMAMPDSGDDWFELHNAGLLPVALGGLYLTDTSSEPKKSRIPVLTFLEGGGFGQFLADEHPENGADHVNFKLGSTGDSIALFATNGATSIDTITFGPQTSGISQGRFPDGNATFAFFPATPSPEESNHLSITNVVINEVLTHSDPPFEDAIELHNPTPSPANIGGWFLSDELASLKKFRIPDGTVIEPNGFKVFYEYQFNAAPGSASSFSLSSGKGDDVYLSATDAAGNLSGYRTHVDFGPAQNGVSFGRFATSAGIDFTSLGQRTLGLDNPTSLAEFRTGAGLPNAWPGIGPIVISEIMYRPPDLGTNDNTRDEFIELHNLTGAPVPLFDPANPANTWRLRDAVDFDFPMKVTMAPRSYLLVVGFDPATNAVVRAAFEAQYGKSALLFGPYTGKLDNSSDDLKLYRPDSPQTLPGPEFGLVPYLLVDRVKYSDVSPWPAEADGFGPSLQRTQVSAYGNEPANWFASGFTPGTSYLANNPPGVTITSPAEGAVFGASAGIVINAVAEDSDGSVTKVEFFAGGAMLGESTVSPYVFTWSNAPVGTHSLTARAIDDDSESTISGPINITVTSDNPDSDNDGMPDAWETAHGLMVGVNDGALDPDQDGLNNLQEYVAGTEPRNGLSSLKIEALKRGAEVLLRFTAQANKAYTVHVRTDLTSGAWQTLSNISAQALIKTIELNDPAVTDTHRYYRLLTPSAP